MFRLEQSLIALPRVVRRGFAATVDAVLLAVSLMLAAYLRFGEAGVFDRNYLAGQRLRVPTTSQHHNRLNVFGWVAPLLGRMGVLRCPQGNREGFLACLSQMYRRLRDYTI